MRLLLSTLVACCLTVSLRAELHVGDPEEQVTKELGKPMSSFVRANAKTLMFDRGEVVIVDGKVQSLSLKKTVKKPTVTTAPAWMTNGAATASAPVRSTSFKIPSPWPPKLNEPFPDMTLQDHLGRPFTLSSLRGKVLIIEPIGMTCQGCQAFVGAHEKGPFKGIQPDNVPSLEKLLPSYGDGVTLADDQIVYVQLILYNMDLQAPTPAEAREWYDHFTAGTAKKPIVLVGTKEMVCAASYNMIPGFFLVDQNFILKSDSAGHNPKNNLYTEILPAVPKLISRH